MAEFRGLEAAENGVEDFRNGLVIPPQTDEKYPGQSPSQWSEAREIEELGVRCVGQEDLEAQLIHEAEEAFRQELSERPPQEVSKDGADSLESEQIEQPSCSSTSGDKTSLKSLPWEIIDTDCQAIRIGEITPFEQAKLNPLSNEGSKEEKTVIRRSKFCHVEKRADSDFEILEESEDSEYEDSRKSSKRKKKSGGWKKSRIDLNDLVDDGDDLKYRSRLENVRKAKLERRYHRIQNDLDDVEDSDSEQTEVSDGYRVPNKVWANLHKYQRTGVRWLLELHRQAVGGILGDEMGLGKTIQMIAFLAGLATSKLPDSVGLFRAGLGPVLLVCPATILHQWVAEFHSWFPLARVAVLHGSGSFNGNSKDSLIKKVHSASYGVLITTYAVLTTDYQLLQKYEWHYVVLDEGHKIRNPDAQVTLAAKQFKTPHRLILSGSPVQNSLKELWSVIDFIYPGRLGTLPVFMQEFSVPITQGGYANATDVQIQTAYKCACILKDAISPYLLRRLKADVQSSIQLPAKNEQVLFCRLTDKQRKLYKAYLSSHECDDILAGNLQIFVGLANLRKICNHSDLITGKVNKNSEDEEDFVYGDKKRSGKLLVVDALLKLWKRQGHRVLLFSQTRQMLDILELYVQQEDFNYKRMDGNTSIGSRQSLVNQFNGDSRIFLFLLSTRVGGVGLNLTGADRVIIFDPDWNPATDTQARERAWRIGQDKAVTIYRLLTTGTIEEKIYQRQVFKQFLTNRVLRDPRQRRFFKTNDLHELFTLNDDIAETGTLFNAEVKMPKKVDKKLGSANLFKRNELKTMTPETSSEPSEMLSEDRRRQLRELAKKISQKLSSNDSTKTTTLELSASHTENPDRSVIDSGGSTSLQPYSKSDVKRKSRKGVVDGCPIPYVTRNEAFVPAGISNDYDQRKLNQKQDDYVLSKLLKSSNVESALHHDVVVDSSNPDFVLVQSEADKIAKAAAKALARSRRFCPTSVSGLPSWTGRNGVVRKRFGSKRPSDVTSSVVVKLLTPGENDKTKRRRISEAPTSFADLFGAPLSLEGKITGSNAPTASLVIDSDTIATGQTSSADLLSQIRQRQFRLGISLTPTSRSTDSSPLQPNQLDDIEGMEDPHTSLDGLSSDYSELIGEIRLFVAYDKGGEATTKEIVDKFGDRLPVGGSVIFKSMLKEICTFHRNNNCTDTGLWQIKPEFR